MNKQPGWWSSDVGCGLQVRLRACVARQRTPPRHTSWPYTDMVYTPIHEFLGYLRDNGFKTYIVYGGGIDLIRVFFGVSTASHPNRSSAPESHSSTT